MVQTVLITGKVNSSLKKDGAIRRNIRRFCVDTGRKLSARLKRRVLGRPVSGLWRGPGRNRANLPLCVNLVIIRDTLIRHDELCKLLNTLMVFTC